MRGNVVVKYVFGVMGFITGCVFNSFVTVNESIDDKVLFKGDLHSSEEICESYLKRTDQCTLIWISEIYL